MYKNQGIIIAFTPSVSRVKNEKFKTKFNGMYLKKVINNEEVIFLKPLSYMNLSGEVVKKYVDYFKINLSDLLIISDDLDMPCFKIKLKYKGSSGGHNGLKNIIQNINTEEFKRLKIGISNNLNIDTKSYVLSKFNQEELEKLHKKFEITNNIINDFINLDFEKVMSKYNESRWCYEYIF
ncbi:MAG: aminoacyl-tRNA hydrolase [Mycoplasma sp. CAG:611_25_7]|nr:MAG: aminoacyl-tRNA hydrolase [Mycoplasma sp. CAG:611_25_7]